LLFARRTEKLLCHANDEQFDENFDDFILFLNFGKLSLGDLPDVILTWVGFQIALFALICLLFSIESNYRVKFVMSCLSYKVAKL